MRIEISKPEGLCAGGAWLRTTFPDGTVVDAHPQHGPEDETRAHELGYLDVDAMTMDHDLMHQVVSSLVLGVPSRVVTGTMPEEFAHAEEDVVMALQRYLNLARKHGLAPAPADEEPSEICSNCTQPIDPGREHLFWATGVCR